MDKTNMSGFYGLGIAPGILETIERFGFSVPTPIQQKAIPIALEGKDIIGIAQTGTGKTIAFGIPMIQRLAATQGRGLVLVPTRELALQVNEAVNKIALSLNMNTAVIIGGESMSPQIAALKRNPRIIVATPGRLLDHLRERRVRLDDVRVLVLDEADRMLDMGFAPQIEQILKCVPRDRQTMLFSATLPGRIMSIASSHMKLPVRTEIAPSGTAAAGVSQEIFVVQKEDKGMLLNKLLEQYNGPVLLFTRTKRGARRVTQSLKKSGHRAAEIHADRSLNQRKEALEGFKSGRYRVLAATDIAAWGIDVTGIELVINYDLPDDPENYVHRIGRTGRAGREGHAISLATPDQKNDVQTIEKLIKTTIPLSTHPEMPRQSFGPSSHAPSHRPHHRPQAPAGHKGRGGQNRRSPARSHDKLFESLNFFISRKKS
ncbi:MAG: DEAD/DEAH box helicase [Endomicrobiales bacterium]